MAQLPSQDILALLEFKKGIKEDPTGYILQSWNEESIDFNGCPSSWNGIICNGGNVAGVVLDNLNISADADLSVFANLTMLVKLSMSNNSITGTIPTNIADFRNIEYLDVSNNLFSSTLPPEVEKLRGLRNLSLAGNNFSGSIPSSLTKLKTLVSLNLSSNGFTEGIPNGFQQIPNLAVLDLHQNKLDGYIDDEFLLLTSAVHVDLSGNLLSSSKSQERKFLGGLSDSIKYLNLSNNQLTGSLVTVGEVPLFGNLKVLDLSYNQLSGELPEFNLVYELNVLRLGNNRFSGFVPNELLKGDSLVITELDLSSNNLSGTPHL
ncbi:hypothetical protein GIB67_031663 [Kingdonia uniflora]|uniref:Leucine-rich repeat-containing N-terminal plant-type domain-containing protein n=1 Tax=Kingdonia uniflora TaxID=39325 RepID=A0A7J7NKI2_9MAGN|nr:hypothetical protein GIB67_031663 [Kingdonia uniflora]